jgi:glycosyltransferase involved in cell wall biosynthesis
MTTKPLISIVMPSFNHARFIGAAIDSVLAQDYRPIELSVMDGGSTDGTVDILRGYGAQLRFVSQRDRGQSDALNRGFQMVRGDILCWLNSDDLFLPGALTKVADAFRRHPEAGFVYGKGVNVNEAGLRPRDSGVLPFNLWKLIHHRNFLHQPSCFFRRSLWEEVGPIRTDLHYVMDWELWIRLASRPGHFVDSPLSCNRSYAANKTNSGAFRRWDEIRRMVKPYAGQSCPPVEAERQALAEPGPQWAQRGPAALHEGGAERLVRRRRRGAALPLHDAEPARRRLGARGLRTAQQL